MTPAAFLRFATRESRGSRGRLAFFALCLAVGVAAVVSVAGLSAGVDEAIRAGARELLAADLAVRGMRPIPEEVRAAVAAIPGVRWVEVRETGTVVAAPSHADSPGRSQLVELKAVGAGYPFYGTCRLDPDRALAELLGPEGAVAAPELLSRLGLAVGDRIRIGEAEFAVRGKVLSEPDRVNVSFTLGPRVFVSLAGLARTRLDRFGGRISHRLLLRLPDGSGASRVEAAAGTVKSSLPASGAFRVETFADAQPALRQGLDRAARFLGLVALLSLVVGGIGVAQAVRAWLESRMDPIAILKCLGARFGEILALYLGQAVLLGLAGSAAGALAGVLALLWAPSLLGGLLPATRIDPWQPMAVLRGLALGVGVAVVFALPSLVSVRRVPPLRVLRRDAEPLRASRRAGSVAALALVGGVFATAWVQSRSAAVAAVFAAGITAAAAALAAASCGVTRAMGILANRFVRVWARHGLRAVARPGAGTLAAIVALGLGTLVVVAMALVQSRLADRLRAELPANAPTAFLVGIEPSQWPALEVALREAGATRIDAVPIIGARLARIDGRPVVERIPSEARGERHREWVFTREQNLTFLERLPPGNEIVEGALWSDPGRKEISIERDFARELGVGVGSTLTFDVQGVPVDLAVTSLRTVEWRTFGINFFLVVEPGVLDGAPQSRVAAFRLPPGSDQSVQDRLAAAFPNVVMIRIREVLEKVGSVLDRAGLGIRILGGFTMLAGIAILGGAIGAGSLRRAREVALLKTIGMSRWGVVAVLSVEYALIGAVAGIVGAAGGGLLAWAVLVPWMDIGWGAGILPFAAAVAATAVLSVLAGISVSLGALARRPAEVFRAE